MKKREIIKERAITLIALVITIIVLLILAGVTISTLTGENGLITKASEAKIMTAVGTVKEEIRLEQVEKSIDGEKINSETLLAEGKIQRTVQQGEDENYYMYYALKEEAYEGMQGLGKGNLASLKDVFLIDDNLNVKYIASNGKEYGDNINNKILEDETEIRFASKAFSEYVSRISGITEEEMKFKWMKNQTSLVIKDPSVDNLEDLVFFPNLTKLVMGDWSSSSAPSVTKLDGVENCTKLTDIEIYYGPNKDYTALSACHNLTSFKRLVGKDYDNIIDTLKSCKNLQLVTMYKCGITDMKKIGQLGDLKSLNLSNNGITKIEGLENKTSLTELNLGSNKIRKIEGLENLANLQTLILNKNQIIDITPLSINQKLTELNLKGNIEIDGNINNYTGEKLIALNKIGEILDRKGKLFLDKDKIGLFTNYKKLDLSNENLQTLELLEGMTELTYLNLSSNQITLEDKKSQDILKSMKNLETLDLENNKITNVTALNNLNKLKNLYIGENNGALNLAEMEDIISNLNDFRISTGALKTIENCDINKITKLSIPYSPITELPELSKFSKLAEIYLPKRNTITNLNNLESLTNLQILKLNEMSLHGKMINFSKLAKLTRLELRDNNLWSEDLENLKALKNNMNLTIDLRNNAIIYVTPLIELDSSCKILLGENINLTKESKETLKAKFGSNVSF